MGTSARQALGLEYMQDCKRAVIGRIDESTLPSEQTTRFPIGENIIRILRNCRRKQNLADAKCVYLHLCDNGLESHRILGNYLVPMFVECGSMSDALQVFNRLIHRNEHSWTSLIQGFVECRESQYAVNLYQQMQDDFVHPSSYTFVALLKGCARLECVERGQEIHTQIVKEGYERELFVSNTLVDMYAKCGLLAEAHEVFDELPVLDVVSWNALIAGYVEQGLSEEALNCLERMQLECVHPSAVTIVLCLKACCSLAKDRGQRIHARIAKKKFANDSYVGNALVDMYAKCGLFTEAQEMLEELPVRDVVSWTALMGGFAEHGLGERALECFEHMQLEGLSANSVTFVCSLKACGSIGVIDGGRAVHAEIAKEGLQRDISVGNTLVDMYAKCGSLAEAWEVFESLPVQDMISWTVLLSGCTEYGLGDEALNCFQQMQLAGISPDTVTFGCSLKACGTLKVLSKGQEIYTAIAKRGLMRDLSIGNALVDMYAKCGLLGEALVVLDNLPVHNAALWNTLIAGYVERGLNEQSLESFQQMEIEGVSVDVFTLVCIVKSCGNIRGISKGQEIHIAIIKGGHEKDPSVCSTLVDFYNKCASIAQAQDVFDKLLVQDVVLWNTLMRGYIEHGLCDEVRKCLQQMQQEGISWDAVTFICCLKSFGRVKAIDCGREIHADVGKNGYERDLFIGNALVDMYAKCGLFLEAQEVLVKLPVRDVVSWNALITGYCEHGLGGEALNCFQQMQVEAISPNAVTFICLSKVCGGIAALDEGRELHMEITRLGFESELFVGSSLVDMYAKCESLSEAEGVLDKLLVRDVVSWNALIAGYAEHGLIEEILKCIQLMDCEGVLPNIVTWNAMILGYAVQGGTEMALVLYSRMQDQGLIPNITTFVCILKACGNSAATEIGEKIHSQIHTLGLDATEINLATALIDMYGKCGIMADAQSVFNAMPTREVVTWNALISGYAHQGDSHLVLCLLGRMTDGGVQPDGITFLSVLTVCSYAGLLENCQDCFEAMSKEYSIVPSIKHHNCIVDLLCRAGQVDVAVAMLDKMPCQPDHAVWNTVLGACWKWGNVELGQKAYECAIGLDEKHVAAYILMSNIYADAHMWEAKKREKL